MGIDRRRLGALAAAFAVGMLVSAVALSSDGGSSISAAPSPAVPTPSPSSAVAHASPSPSGELHKVGGVPAATAAPTVDPRYLPYPYLSPTPPPTTTTVLDGTFMRTLTLRDVGGARIGLPFRCLRCPPYRVDAGVSTIMFHQGAYYLHHQMSDFKTQGSFRVEGDHLIVFNDPNCPQEEGVYAFELTAHALKLRVIHDECPWSGERAIDLTRTAWTDVHVCFRWVKHLWPGAVAC